MKNLILSVVLVILSVASVNAQKYVKNGNVFSAVSTRSGATAKNDTIVTPYEFADSKGVKYHIIIKKSSGRCYIWKKSSKTGKMYKMYLSGKNKPIAQYIAHEMNIEYVEKKSSK